jgi:hypothetical protein
VLAVVHQHRAAAETAKTVVLVAAVAKAIHHSERARPVKVATVALLIRVEVVAVAVHQRLVQTVRQAIPALVEMVLRQRLPDRL